MVRVRSNRVTFTLNNYEQKDLEDFEKYFENNKKIIYGVVGQEIGENGTPHLQGFIHYDMDTKKGGINFWKKEIPGGERAHFETARGTDQQNEEYCTKEGVFIETGTPSDATSKWDKVLQTAKVNLEDALEIDAEISVKYFNQLQAIHNKYGGQKMQAKLEKLRDWQETALRKLKNQTERQILFVVDIEGGKGKSALCRHLMTTEDAWACQGELKYYIRQGCGRKTRFSPQRPCVAPDRLLAGLRAQTYVFRRRW